MWRWLKGECAETSALLHIWMTIQVRVPGARQVLDSTELGTGMIFYLRVTPIADLNRDGYGTVMFFHPRVTRGIPDTLLSL
jgi:hypothetical protein